MLNINRIAYWHVTGRFAKMRVVVECADQIWTARFLEGKMVANTLITDHGAMINTFQYWQQLQYWSVYSVMRYGICVLNTRWIAMLGS